MIDIEELEFTVDRAIGYMNIDISWGQCETVSYQLKEIIDMTADSRVIDPCSLVYLQPEACSVWGTGHRVLLVDDSYIIDPVAQNSVFGAYFTKSVFYIEEYKNLLKTILERKERA